MKNKNNLILALDEIIKAQTDMLKAVTSLKEALEKEETVTTKTSKKKEALVVNEPVKQEEETAIKYSFQEVRGLMAKLSTEGKKNEVKALLVELGVNRLSEVKEEDYPSLMAKAKELVNE